MSRGGVGEEVLRDGLNLRIDLIEADAVAGCSIGCYGADSETDDADVAWAGGIIGRSTAVANGEAYAGVASVVGGGDLHQVGGEELGSVLDGSVDQRAHGDALRGGDALLDAEGSVEVAGLEEGPAAESCVEEKEEPEEEDAAGGPEEALGPALGPGDDEGHECSEEEGDGEVVVGREDEGAGDADEEGSGGSAGCDEEVEEGGLGRVVGAEVVGLGMAEETGDEALGEEEEEADDYGEGCLPVLESA